MFLKTSFVRKCERKIYNIQYFPIFPQLGNNLKIILNIFNNFSSQRFLLRWKVCIFRKRIWVRSIGNRRRIPAHCAGLFRMDVSLEACSDTQFQKLCNTNIHCYQAAFPWRIGSNVINYTALSVFSKSMPNLYIGEAASWEQEDRMHNGLCPVIVCVCVR
jgi:hypothetical protein